MQSVDHCPYFPYSLGPALPEEELEDARNNLGALDPLVIARVADRIADLAQIQDRVTHTSSHLPSGTLFFTQDRFRHKFLSAFASSLVDHGSPAEDSEEGEEEDIYEDVDDFFMPPAKVDQEESLEARREAARVDRIAKRVKDTMAEVLPVHRYIEDEDAEEETDVTYAERT